mgnify:CR=1 FL=1
MTGVVYKSTGSWYHVKNATGELIPCRIKGKFRIEGHHHSYQMGSNVQPAPSACRVEKCSFPPFDGVPQSFVTKRIDADFNGECSNHFRLLMPPKIIKLTPDIIKKWNLHKTLFLKSARFKIRGVNINATNPMSC